MSAETLEQTESAEKRSVVVGVDEDGIQNYTINFGPQHPADGRNAEEAP